MAAVFGEKFSFEEEVVQSSSSDGSSEEDEQEEQRKIEEGQLPLHTRREIVKKIFLD
eukprot:gene21358-8131_t